jgi:hypothetical protein
VEQPFKQVCVVAGGFSAELILELPIACVKSLSPAETATLDDVQQ